ncbi:MAG TPA: zinc ribbon domain-containing protein [Anaerolineae bacterium]|nr:zinc ribbon domain-containing protein [Anaerolineae bacterium]
MIYCPNCGTANRDGSRFCNDCGHKLPSKTGIVCPMCSHMNPPANVYCDKCQARLVPAGPASPPVAPGAPAPPAPVKKGLSLPTKPADEIEPPPGEPETTPGLEPEAEPEETPEWLHRLRAATPKPPPQAAPEFPSGEEIPEWMRPAEGEQLDWFDRLAGEPPPSSPEKPAPAPVEEEPEAWMLDLASGSAMRQEATQAPEGEAGLPDWLKELTPPSAAPADEPTLSRSPERSEGEAEEPALSGVEGSLDWLTAAAQEPQPGLGEPPVAGEIPDWLAELGLEAAAPEISERPSEPVEPPSPAPDTWHLEQGALSEQPQPAETGLAGEGHGWPADLQAQPPAEEREPPAEDWRGWPPSTTLEEPSPTGEEPAGEVPDWLKDLGAGPIGPEEAGAPAAAGAPPSGVEPPGDVSAFAGADIDTADLAATPDWLAQVQEPAREAPEQREEPAPSELPDWLREIGPMPALAPSETPFGEMPSPPGEARELIPPGEAQLADRLTTPAFADEQGRTLTPDLEAAAIPSWLEALRPVAAPTGAAEEGVIETEGLLAGLQNVLPATPFIGKPQGAPAARHAQVPPADIARAELFQRLLSTGALAPTAVKPETAGAQARLRANIVRWVIVVALVLAAFAPNLDDFMAELGIFQLGSVDPALYAGAAAQIDSLDQGQRVLMSFDYDASQAGEMDPIAEAFLVHIRQRGAQAIAVSLNPNGVALGARVVESLGEKGIPDAAFVQTSFHPGQAVGAQSALLSVPADLIVVLAGSPEAMRWWVEQATFSGAEAPIVAGASAGALPQIQPYLQSEQVDAVVQGLMGGLAYRRSLDPDQDAGEPGFDRLVRSEALYLSQIAFAAIILAGLIVSLAAGRGRRPDAS